jgi:hypothetical protein
MRPFVALAAAVLAVMSSSGCATTPTPTVAVAPSLATDFPIDCGPVSEPSLCQKAIEVAATAKLNPPPIVEASVRRPVPEDSCTRAFHPCDREAVIVTIQSGDTLQDVPLVRTADGWVLHALIR